MIGLAPGTARLWLAEPNVCEDDPALLAIVSAEEVARLRRYLRPEDRRLFLAAHTLLRQSLSRCAPAPPASWSFVQGPYGRPELYDRRLRFSLSHAPGLVGCLVTETVDCGLDIEDTTRVENPLDLARTVFSDAECDLLERSDSHLRRQRFFEIWTLKEAYVKARGMGLFLPLDCFSFGLQAGAAGTDITFTSEEDPPQHAADWQFELSYPTPHHVAAVALQRQGTDLTVTSEPA